MNFKHKKHKKTTPRHIIVKFFNKSDKEKILKAAREKPHVTYGGTKVRKIAIPHLKLCKTLEQHL